MTNETTGPDGANANNPNAPTTDSSASTDPTSTSNPPQSSVVDDDTGGENENRNAEAARYRKQRNEARSERDQLQHQLDAQRNAVVTAACAAAHLDERLWAAAGVDLSELEVDGILDAGRVSERVAEVVAEFGISTTRPPRPNPYQGHSGGSSGGGGSWSGLLKDATRR